MKLRRMRVEIWIVIGIMFLWPGFVFAQTGGNTQLQIRLRNSDGTAVIGEAIILQRLPEEAPILPNCITDSNGECIWYVGRGLYQLLFERQLDNVTALALAEGGLRGFGVTVGDEDIVYHFTFQNDGRVYFDTAPNAPVPSPLLPTFEAEQGGGETTLPQAVIDGTPTGVVTLIPTVSVTAVPEEIGETAVSPNPIWRLLIFITVGILLGGAVYLWSRAAQQRARLGRSQSPIRTQEESDA